MDDSKPVDPAVALRHQQIRTVLEQAPWYSGCLPETGQAILDQATVRELRRGEVLSRTGDCIEQLTLIIEGVLEVCCTAPSGKRHIAGYVTRGDLYNLVPFMDKVPVTHDTIAISDSLTLQLGSPLVTTLMSSDSAFTSAVIVLLSQRSRHTYLTLADNALLPLRQRIARTLLHLSNQFGLLCHDGVHLNLKIAQDQLADFVGCSRPALNRELKQLERELIIQVRYSKIVVIDESMLTAIAIDG